LRVEVAVFEYPGEILYLITWLIVDASMNEKIIMEMILRE